jgi:adenylosuccinate synthase
MMTDVYPYDTDEINTCTPIYKQFKGWKDLSDANSFSSLPSEAQEYLLFIQEYLKIPIALISIGPERNETIKVDS